MSSMFLSERTYLKRLANASAAGTTDVDSSSIDLGADNGYPSCRLAVLFGAIVSGAATSIKVQSSSDDSTFNDLTGTSVTVADDDDNQIVYVDVVKPLERYLRIRVVKATQNSTVDGIFAEAYDGRIQSSTDDATTVSASSERHVSPVEGTA